MEDYLTETDQQQKQHHSERHYFKCGGCGKSFETKRILKNHKDRGAKKCRFKSSSYASDKISKSVCDSDNSISSVTEENIQNQIFNEEVILKKQHNQISLEQHKPVQKSKDAYNFTVFVQDNYNANTLKERPLADNVHDYSSKNIMARKSHQVRNTGNKDGLKAHRSEACNKGALNNQENNLTVRPYQCTACSKPFAKKQQMVNHTRDDCDKCDQRFSSGGDLVDHKTGCTEEEKENVDMTDVKIPDDTEDTDGGLDDQVAKDTKLEASSKKYPCDVCNRQFCNKYELIRHILSHKRESSYFCVGCDQIFSSKSNIELHNEKFHST